MKNLFVDLASHSGILACVAEHDASALQQVDHRIGDHELLPIVEQSLRDVHWTFQELTHVACVVGPGGFTSLRVAVAFANTLADQLGIPSAGVHLSDLSAARAEAPDFLWLHSTKRQELFVRGFGSFADLWPEPTLLKLDAFLDLLPRGASWAGELLPEHQEAMAPQELQRLPLQDVREILPAFVSSLSYEKRLLHPWYGRGY